MNTKLITLLNNNKTLDEEQLRTLINEIKSTLQACNNLEELTQGMKKCQKQYQELLKLAGELNDIFDGEQ